MVNVVELIKKALRFGQPPPSTLHVSWLNQLKSSFLAMDKYNPPELEYNPHMPIMVASWDISLLIVA